MPLETSFNSIADLNVNWPTGPDLVNKGDDHIRGVKQALKNTFPQIDKPLTITADGLNAMAASVDATGAQITMKKPVDMGNARVMSVAAPTSDADAANKKFVTDADATVLASAKTYALDEANAAKAAAISAAASDAASKVAAGVAPKYDKTGGTISGNVVVQGAVNADSNIATKAGVLADGEVHGAKIVSGGDVIANGDVSAANIHTSGGAGITGDLQAANVHAGGIVATGTGFDGPALHVSDFRSAFLGAQGMTIGWNETAGSGMGTFVTNKGSGVGGFKFRAINANNTVEEAKYEMTADRRFNVYGSDQKVIALMNGTHHGIELFSALGNNAGGQYLEFRIDGAAFGVQIFSSDRKYKSDIQDADASRALDILDKLRPVSYLYKGSPVVTPFGLIAQEVEEVFPEAVNTLSDDSKELSPLMLIGLLVTTVKELRHEIAQLRADAGL